MAERIEVLRGPFSAIYGNHPLAGMALRFELEVVEVRAATDEEIQHGHVHGAHGHHPHGDEHEDGDDSEAGDHFRSLPLH